MAISKGAVAAGVLGTGSAVTATTITTQYIYSKSSEDNLNDEVPETSNVSPEEKEEDEANDLGVPFSFTRIAQFVDASVIQDGNYDQTGGIKMLIAEWAKSPGEGCVLKVQLKNEEEQKNVNDISDMDALSSLLSFLMPEGSNAEAKEKCKKSKEENKDFVLQQQNNDSWVIK